MLDLQTRVATLKRPALLARAARFGLDDYRRTVHLQRILQHEDLPGHAEAIVQLLDIEAEMNTRRETRCGTYSPARHVDILIAISAETSLMQATAKPQEMDCSILQFTKYPDHLADGSATER